MLRLAPPRATLTGGFVIRNQNGLCTRRSACAWLGAGAGTLLLPPLLRAQEALLPVRATDLDHFGITVRDSVKTAEFFGRVFDPQLFREMDSATRLYVKLGVAHMAIGNRAYWTREQVELPVLDHICARVQDYREAETHKALTDAGIVLGAGRNFPLDPDGLFLQLGAAPGGMSRTIIPATRVTHGDPIVHPVSLDHIMVAATDLERSDEFYSLIFGAASARTRNPDRIWYDIGDTTKLGLQRVGAGEKPSFHHFSVRVAGYDRRDATERLEQLGAQIVSSDEELLRFRDPNGIVVELTAA
jgi:catechol 2,3-dioxygenase-like lactoylglutathione lyase family enzyme